MSVAGSKATWSTDGGEPDWSPDGDEIVFTGADGIYVMASTVHPVWRIRRHLDLLVADETKSSSPAPSASDVTPLNQPRRRTWLTNGLERELVAERDQPSSTGADGIYVMEPTVDPVLLTEGTGPAGRRTETKSFHRRLRHLDVTPT